MAKQKKPVAAKCDIHIGRYLSSTMDFSAVHHGMYFLLAGEAMKNHGVLPNREDFLAEATKCTVQQWRENSGTVARFFDVDDENWTLKADHFDRVRVVYEDGGRLPNAEWATLRAKIFKRDAFTCTYCGATDQPLECDHIVPVSKGGTNDDDNLTTACKPCNRSKNDKLVDEWRGNA